MHFLREELKEKSVLLRSIIISSNSQRNKSSDKTPENPTPTFPSKENNDTKEHALPQKMTSSTSAYLIGEKKNGEK